jgi:hypothetical protein
MIRGVVVAWGSTPPEVSPSLALLGGIVAGNGHTTSKPTSQVSLRGDSANSSSATNVSLFASFKGGNTSLTPEDDSYDAESMDGTYLSYSCSHSSTGTYFVSRVLDTNNTAFANMWNLYKHAGDDNISLSNQTKTTTRVNINVVESGDDNDADDWDINQNTVNGTLLYQFYGNQLIASGNFIIEGGGDV